jgi:hypothetical protein
MQSQSKIDQHRCDPLLGVATTEGSYPIVNATLVLANLPPEAYPNIGVFTRQLEHLTMIEKLDSDGAQRFHRVGLANQKNRLNPEEVAGQEYSNYLATVVRHVSGSSDPASSQPIDIVVRLSFQNDSIAWPEGPRIR